MTYEAARRFTRRAAQALTTASDNQTGDPMTPDPLARCDCGHLTAHHGETGCEHTPGYDDPYAHPSYYAGEPGDCACTLATGRKEPPMRDLIAWLRTQLDDDEQAAQAATPGHWAIQPGPYHGYWNTITDEQYAQQWRS